MAREREAGYIFVSYMTVIGYLLHDWLAVEHVYILHHHFQEYEVDHSKYQRTIALCISKVVNGAIKRSRHRQKKMSQVGDYSD
jgi:hypothetical protein